MRRVCLDASVWFKVLTEEADYPHAQKLVEQLFRERTEIVAPGMMKMEVGSILLRKWIRKQLPDEALEELYSAFLDLPIRYVDTPELARKAWYIARQNGLAHHFNLSLLRSATMMFKILNGY